MLTVTYLPLFITVLLRGMPGVWHHRHRLMLCWLIVMQALFPGQKTLAELARWTPGSLPVWRFRRVLKAAYCFALSIATWDVYRFPVAFRLIRVKTHPQYQTENALFREMVSHFVPPPWATRVIVEGDAAYGSQDNMKMVMQRDAVDPVRRWDCVFAIARTWKTVEGKAIKDVVTHLPRTYYQRTLVPRLPSARGRKTFWVYSTRLCLRHIGDVTVGLNKRGRNLGPKQTKILVTNLDEWLPRQVVSAYQRRWPIELLHWELKSGLGLGKHQVSGDKNRSEKSLSIAVLAYLFVLRVCHHEIVPGKPWSIFQLQHALRLRVMTNQVEHQVKVKMGKTHKAA
jgi:hypothetical protein